MRTIAFIFCIILSSAAVASGSEGKEKHEGEGHHKHVLALFAGVTVEEHEDLATLGIEYSYRFHKNWSVGGVIERAEREKDSTLAIAFIHLWPVKGLFLGVGAGRKDPGDERETTYRYTIGYEFELGNGWGIAPQANLDVIENHEDEKVLGIAVGKRF